MTFLILRAHDHRQCGTILAPVFLESHFRNTALTSLEYVMQARNLRYHGCLYYYLQQAFAHTNKSQSLNSGDEGGSAGSTGGSTPSTVFSWTHLFTGCGNCHEEQRTLVLRVKRNFVIFASIEVRPTSMFGRMGASRERTAGKL